MGEWVREHLGTAIIAPIIVGVILTILIPKIFADPKVPDVIVTSVHAVDDVDYAGTGAELKVRVSNGGTAPALGCHVGVYEGSIALDDDPDMSDAFNLQVDDPHTATVYIVLPSFPEDALLTASHNFVARAECNDHMSPPFEEDIVYLEPSLFD